ncbi:hypothetical protein FIE12Z_1478 [Fusarium flagelliforme]|uniref:Uncharacterized protein n=1 Tax=Fusarium flagelliforme TaxID=2675880 RepID=A0A395N2J6_9HYPO|nr:hypothetical protein FIE12Z_1478 [Fusarium flagelliforme]
MKVEPNHEAGMNIPSFGQQNISPSTLPIQGELVYYAMFGQKREDGVQTSPADGSSSNEPASYSNTQPKFEIKNNLTALALNCSHAAANAMNKLSIPQLESWYQRVSMLVQKSPPEPHGDSTQLNNGTHEYSVPSPEFMYQFRGHSDLYVGWEDKVRPDQIYIDRWEHKVLPRLWTDIREFEKKMRRSSRIVRGRPGLSISPELRMSGRVEASHKVKLLPRIWILYGHERWRRSVLKFVSELEWLSLEGFGEVEVHLGSVKLSALESSSALPGLDFNEDHMYCLDDQTTLYLHVEQPQGDSACGLVCCATVFRGGAIMSQRLSRIGGILRVNNELFGVTTAHGMLEWFVDALLDSETDAEISDDESLDYPLPSDDEDEGVPSTQFRIMDTAIENAIDINRVRQWSRVSVGLTSFLQTSYYCLPGMNPMIQQTGLEDARDHIASREAALCSDFSLWGLQHAEELHNSYTTKDGQMTVDALASGQDAPEGPVQLLLGIAGISQGFLLPGTMFFLVHGTQFKTRKIRTTKPLGMVS